jgi:hypothetical protein
MDYKNKRLKLSLRQPIIGPMQNIILDVCMKGLEKLTLSSIESHFENAYYLLIFKDLHVISHISEYDYANEEPVYHNILMNYNELEIEQKLVFK